MSAQQYTGICPCCRGFIDYFHEPGKQDVLPYAGLISICSTCGEVCVVEDDLSLVKMTDEQKEYVKQKAPDNYQKMIRISDHIRTRFSKRQTSLFNLAPQSFSKN